MLLNKNYIIIFYNTVLIVEREITSLVDFSSASVCMYIHIQLLVLFHQKYLSI